MRRWLRCLVCLLVICALLINLSPLRVKATGVTAGGVAVGVGIGIAVAAGLNALGVREGSDSASFSEVVSSCTDALSSRFAIDGLVTFLSLTQNGVGKTYASANFLQAILDFLWDSCVLTSTLANSISCGWTHGDGYTFSSNEVFGAGYFYDYYGNLMFILYSSVSNCVVVQSREGYSNSDISLSKGPFSGYYYYACYAGSTPSTSGLTYLGKVPTSNSSGVDDVKYILSTLGGTIVSSSDLTLETVGQDLDTDYKTYVDTGIVDIEWGVHFEENGDGSDDDNGGGMVGVPVRIPDLSTDSFTDQTQEEAQTGDTPQDVLDQLLNQSGSGGSGSGTGDGTGSGNTGNTGSTWVPPSGHTQFALADLSNYFPFCIPFDLFDFFTLLDADPVAPVLSWEIQDLSGQTYALSVDLSEWDSVAQLFRRLQLFLFICGLAAASRKYIKW